MPNDKEEEEENFLVFQFDKYYDDDIPAICCVCGAVGTQRPHNPVSFKRICINCMVKKTQESPDEVVKLAMTEKTAEEIRDFIEAQEEEGGH